MADEIQAPEQPATPAPETAKAEPDPKTTAWNKGFGKAMADIRSSLGVADIDEAKAILEEARKVREEKLMADGKLSELLEAEKQKAVQLEERMKQIEAEAMRANMKSAFVAKAAGKVVDLDAAYVLADLSKVEASDGSFAGIDEAIDSLVKAKPWLVASEQNRNIGSASNPGQTNNLPGSIREMSKSEFDSLLAQVQSGKTINLAKN